MKKLVAILLSVFMLVSLCAVSTSALEDADNGNIKLLAKADMSDAFYEGAGPQDMYGFDVKGYVDLGNGEELIGSTFANYGYHTFMNVDGANGKMDGMLYYGATSAYTYADQATDPALVSCRSQPGFAQGSGGSNKDGFSFSVKLAFRDRRKERSRSMAQDFLQCVGGNRAVPVVKRIQLLICIDDFVNRSFVVYDLKIRSRQQQRRRKQSKE